jgi:O-antigen ligase
MINTEKKLNIHLVFALLTAVTIPFLQRLLPLVIALHLLFTLIFIPFSKAELKQTPRFIWLLPLFYLLHLLSFTYTQNKELGLLDLEVKLSFLILPLIYYGKKINFSTQQFYLIIDAFCISTAIAVITCFAHSIYLWMQGETVSSAFFGNNFSFFMHLSYFAAYCNLALLFLLIRTRNTIKSSLSKHSVLLIIGIVLYTVGVFLSASRTGIVSWVLVIIPSLLYLTFTLKAVRLPLLLVGFSLAFFLFILQKQEDNIVLKKFTTYITQLQQPTEDSSGEKASFKRDLIWKNSLELIKDNYLIGVGSGDVRDELVNYYEKNNLSFFIYKRYNTHNQFLQAFAAIGVLGFVIMLLLIPGIIIQGIMYKKSLLLAFGAVFLLLSLSESIFEVQAGVVGFCFFFCVLLSKAHQHYSTI